MSKPFNSGAPAPLMSCKKAWGRQGPLRLVLEAVLRVGAGGVLVILGLLFMPYHATAGTTAAPGVAEANPCPPAEDVNLDGWVNMADINFVAGAWHRTPAPAYADRNGDGEVSVVDLMHVIVDLDKHCPGAGQPIPLNAVNDFLYQLQNLDLTAIGDTAYDLVVMDYSADGSGEMAFTSAQIQALKHSAGGEKLVLAYLSIGEAEDYRYYWDPSWDDRRPLGVPDPDAPAWLDLANPDWPGNYKVHYWDPEWQGIILGYVDWLLSAGYDGAYLDIIDAYMYYTDQGRTTAAQEMSDFVAAIAAHARDRDPDFYIFPQNGAALVAQVSGYLDVVAGVGQEDIYYGYEGDDVMTPPDATADLESYLDLFKVSGKLVLTVDYATTPAYIDDAYAKAQAKGYVPFVTVRDLDQLTMNAGHEPD